MRFDNSAQGLYRTEILRPDGTVRYDSGLHGNMITDNGLNEIGYSLGSFLSDCYVGTGTNPPTAGDTSLQNQVMRAASGNRVATNRKQVSAAPYYSEQTCIWTFDAATANVTLGEMGTAGNNQTNKILTRSLMKDTEGNPTTVTLLVGEVLRITHVLRLYFDMSEKTGSFQIGSETYNYTARAIRMNESSYWNMGDTWSYPEFIYAAAVPVDAKWANIGLLNQGLDKSEVSQQLYSVPTGRPTMKGTGVYSYTAPYTVNQANYPLGLRYFYIVSSRSNYRSGPSYGVLLDKAIMKTDKFNLTVTMDISWKRYTP